VNVNAYKELLSFCGEVMSLINPTQRMVIVRILKYLCQLAHAPQGLSIHKAPVTLMAIRRVPTAFSLFLRTRRDRHPKRHVFCDVGVCTAIMAIAR
jgi:hypothetical protein